MAEFICNISSCSGASLIAREESGSVPEGKNKAKIIESARYGLHTMINRILFRVDAADSYYGIFTELEYYSTEDSYIITSVYSLKVNTAGLLLRRRREKDSLHPITPGEKIEKPVV